MDNKIYDINKVRSSYFAGEMYDLNNVEKNFYDDVDSMIRLKVKAKLFSDINVILADISKMQGVYSALGRRAKRIRNRTLRQLDIDQRKGLKKINESISVFVELPKYEKRGDGYIKKDGESEEITINPPLTSSLSSEKIEYNDTNLLDVEETISKGDCAIVND